MNGNSSRLPLLLVIFLLATGLIYLFENFLPAGRGGSLLFTLLFWVSIVEGAIAVVAAGEITTGKWVKPYRRELLSLYPFLIFLALLFVVFIPRVKYYPWTNEPGLWLNENLFVARSILLLLIAFFAARKFAKEALQDSPRKTFWGVIYLFVFVTSQTSVAFDWVMSLEYPWYSTLFGGYFFIEAFYAGLAMAGIFTFVFRKSLLEKFGEDFENARRDMATLLFAFATFWGAQFYTQYIVIWYGNIPEEVFMVVERISHSPWRELSYTFIFLLFVVPFVVFISKKMKANYYVFLTISLIVWLGLAMERFVLVGPQLAFGFLPFVLEMLLTGAVFLFMVKIRDSLLLVR